MDLLASQTQVVNDVNDLPIIKNKAGVRASDRLLSADQVSAIQRGTLDASAVLPPEPSAPAAAAPAPIQISQAAIPVPAVAPPQADDLAAKINRIFGTPTPQVDPAIGALHQKVDALFERLNSGAPAHNQNAYTNQYGSQPTAQAGPLTRDDLMQALQAQRQEFHQALMFQQAQAAASASVDTEFPQIARDPALRAAADRIFSSDPSLQRDPTGRLKAAAIAIGLSGSASPARVPADVQKAALTGIGSSSVESSAPVDPNRYAQALEYAKRTGDLSDFARARRIQQGME